VSDSSRRERRQWAGYERDPQILAGARDFPVLGPVAPTKQEPLTSRRPRQIIEDVND
jgi:hypothetical protein